MVFFSFLRYRFFNSCFETITVSYCLHMHFCIYFPAKYEGTLWPENIRVKSFWLKKKNINWVRKTSQIFKVHTNSWKHQNCITENLACLCCFLDVCQIVSYSDIEIFRKLLLMLHYYLLEFKLLCPIFDTTRCIYSM